MHLRFLFLFRPIHCLNDFIKHLDKYPCQQYPNNDKYICRVTYLSNLRRNFMPLLNQLKMYRARDQLNQQTLGELGRGVPTNDQLN